MAKFEDIIKQLSKDGTDFEKLAKWYLENEPKFKKIFKKIWHFKDFPNKWGRDTGTDLVALTYDENYWAIQAKNYNSKYYITKEDIDSFLSDTNRSLISERLLISTTNNIGKNGFSTIQDQEKPVHLELLDNLKKAYVNWPENISKLYPSKIKKHSPWKWQKKAIKQISHNLKSTDKGKIIMACGSGKTEMGIWIDEILNTKKTLVVMPTLYLISQTVDRWCAHCKSDFDFLTICSDKSVVDKDSLIKSLSETILPATTDPNKISNFFRRNKKNVIFSTYNSLPSLVDAIRKYKIKFDLVISDEAHRTASNFDSVFSLVHNRELIPRNKTVYMTATPRIHSPALKAKAKIHNVYMNSMDDEIYGKNLFKLSFKDAVKKKILVDYRILIIGYERQVYNKLIKDRAFIKFKSKIKSDAKSLALKFALIKSFKKYNSKKILSFHTRIKSAKRFSNEFTDLAKLGFLKKKKIQKFWSSSIDGGMSSFDKKNLINQFKSNSNNTFSILTNAKCLTEGVDVPKIDTICFLDPKKSQVDIAQAVGRVMRKAEGKKIGNLIIPLPISNDEHTEEEIYKSEYKEIFSVINAMKDNDEDLTEVLEQYKKGLGPKTSNKKQIGKIIIDLPETIKESFYNELKLKILNRTTSLSKTMISLIKDYKLKFNHLNFSPKDKTPYNNLFDWVDTMRGLYRTDKIPSWIKEELNSIKGFSWRVSGQTLDSVENLYPESIFSKKAGYSGIRKLRENNLINPKGFYPTMGQSDKTQKNERRLSAYYSEDQIDEIKKLGAKQVDLKKYILKEEALKKPGIYLKYFNDKTLEPVEKGLSKSGINFYYDRSKVEKLSKENQRKRTLPGTDILIPSRSSDLKKLEKSQGLVTGARAKEIIGKTLNETIIKPKFIIKNFVELYDLDETLEAKKIIEAEDLKLKKYLNETEVRKNYKLKNISQYRKNKKIIPDDWYYPDKKSKINKKPKPLYLESTIQAFFENNKITIFNTSNYYGITDLIDKSQYSNVKNLFKNGLIKSSGKGITNSGVTDLFEKKTFKEVIKINKHAKKLGFVRGGKVYIRKKDFKVLKNSLNI